MRKILGMSKRLLNEYIVYTLTRFPKIGTRASLENSGVARGARRGKRRNGGISAVIRAL